jgi:hypothetical protein
MITVLNGLRVEVRRPNFPTAPDLSPGANPMVVIPCQGVGVVHVDPGQLPEIRRKWHDRLDQTIGSIRYQVVFWIMMLPPLVAAVSYRWRRRRIGRALAGLCVHCGYDLRASAVRCPECGQPVVVQQSGGGNAQRRIAGADY